MTEIRKLQNKFRILVFLIGGIVAIGWYLYFSYGGCKGERIALDREINGLVVDKINNHGPSLRILENNKEVVINDILSSELVNNISINDSLIKRKGVNKCIIAKSTGVKMTVTYYYEHSECK